MLPVEREQSLRELETETASSQQEHYPTMCFSCTTDSILFRVLTQFFFRIIRCASRPLGVHDEAVPLVVGQQRGEQGEACERGGKRRIHHSEMRPILV
jgi:hypothetical protein